MAHWLVTWEGTPRRLPRQRIDRNSDAMNPEVRCRADRLCRGERIANRLSESLAWPVFFPRRLDD